MILVVLVSPFQESLCLVIENAQVARDNLILQDRTRWNIDSVSVIRNYDDRALETDILAKGNIARNSQMVSLEHVGNGFEAAREFRHLLEVFITEFDQGRRLELTLLGHQLRITETESIFHLVRSWRIRLSLATCAFSITKHNDSWNGETKTTKIIDQTQPEKKN
jgi:hypothetical protein